mmetsp:Transcript_79042/g.183372  ORF Transcript_79042/g.183372 Transcript_79042/m.183372 type:complete len:200 (+) Transcript_79042:307-906(+)
MTCNCLWPPRASMRFSLRLWANSAALAGLARGSPLPTLRRPRALKRTTGHECGRGQRAVPKQRIKPVLRRLARQPSRRQTCVHKPRHGVLGTSAGTSGVRATRGALMTAPPNNQRRGWRKRQQVAAVAHQLAKSTATRATELQRPRKRLLPHLRWNRGQTAPLLRSQPWSGKRRARRSSNRPRARPVRPTVRKCATCWR